MCYKIIRYQEAAEPIAMANLKPLVAPIPGRYSRQPALAATPSSHEWTIIRRNRCSEEKQDVYA